MNKIKEIAYNCKKATSLIDKKQISAISLKEKVELRTHLIGCAVCRTYAKQSVVINNMVKKMFNSSQYQHLKLDEAFKTELQNRINSKLNK